MIPDEVVDEVRLRADLVSVVGEVVTLKRSGREWKGKCPFHDDRTPSFYVVPDKGFYKCFGCGESGDVFAFVMKRSGIPFLDAVKHLGERFGVEVREVESGRGEEDPLRPYYEINAFAREWFRKQLLEPARGRAARAYLEGRGIDADTSERFGLGYAPDGWREFREAAAKHEIPLEHLLEVGLLTSSERSPEPYDRFRNRITFPIESVSGKVLAFGGRTLGTAAEHTPKYLNSPESGIYHKGDVLYGLSWNRNRIRREGVALIVEGYMDVVALAAGGVDHAVATLGTAMTPEQARLLGRYSGKALLLFDSDEAGLKATFRAADLLLAQGVHPSVVTLPPGEDPDSVVRSEGRLGLERYLNGAVDVLDRKLQLLDEKGYFGSIDRVRVAVDKLLPTLRATRDPALRDIYISRVSERTGVRRRTLEVEVETTPASPGGSGAATRGRGAKHREFRSGSRSGHRVPLSGLGPERQLLLILLRSRERVERAAERVGPEEFRDPDFRAIFEALVADPELAPPPEGLSSEGIRKLEELLGDPQELEHTERMFHESLGQLEDRALQKRKEALENELRFAGSGEEKRRLLEELSRLRRERPGRWKVARRDGPVGTREHDP